MENENGNRFLILENIDIDFDSNSNANVNNNIELKQEVFEEMAEQWENKFYHSAAWQHVRKAYIAKQHGLCEKCGKPGYELHHIIPLNPYNVKDLSIALSSDNLMYLCHDCHNKIHGRFGETQRVSVNYHFDKEGNVIPNKPDF